MIDNEPTYHYVKGSGWVASMHDQITKAVGKYCITLIKKTPEPRDYYLVEYIVDGHTMEQVLDQFTSNYQYQLDNGTISWYLTRWTKARGARFQQRDTYDLYTLKMEKVKKPRAPRAPRARAPRRPRPAR